ncbi:band 4.1-like protein 4A [Pollicipes pollicipes]|uniref:band 4.1-like protein 4A n=1 Tax=Pollicipes pollicipes TaxID=41117 RepID=UPI00188589B4|nr:band 4.1-like protein 4A [Pollicipes pollicipes]
MKCFGTKNSTYHCKIILLDEQELIQEIQDTTLGQELLDNVFRHLNLLETAYFGLRFLHSSNQPYWLDPQKKIVQQLKGTDPFTLYFCVKFYAADPCRLLEEITRYQFFLQIKQDILEGRLPVTPELSAELGALVIQSELGDYDPKRHVDGYVGEFRLLPTLTPSLEENIEQIHKSLVGRVPSVVEFNYLEKVRWLEMYGVDLHPVLGEDHTEYFIGLTPAGVIVLRGKVKVSNYFWPRISKVHFKGKYFMLRVRDKNNEENTYGFETPSKDACKHLWKCCVEHHSFFRLVQVNQPSGGRPLSISSRFRYSGRTEKEAQREASLHRRPPPSFSRSSSRRSSASSRAGDSAHHGPRSARTGSRRAGENSVLV